MFEGIPDPMMYGAAVVCFGGWVGLLWMVRMLFTGKMASGRELTEKSKRIDTLEAALGNREKQVDAALAVLPEVADVLRKFHVAAEETREAQG